MRAHDSPLIAKALPQTRPEGGPAEYAFGICIDRHYLTPGFATIASLADSLSPRDRKAAALRLVLQRCLC
ncbi:hypothetical protein [Streptomyces sp. SudanB182_2057]|uniref:hypothetical protein n=1 Tax=Streptomyces sp. SudanB182_2057 TaxID=3035281 RepID=UPI003F557A13